ncbi:putative uridine kinase [Porphyridium purpureum]|uniref:Putative uridine kinase n=1 Tax=Porphyridium purpureum TaxID=35688 RepID=A0A5J4Z4A0_PORPP|nr:putative uridine kinase [Porphyridium purpureum]|eukprot:POR2165..scf295_1
MWPSAVRMKHAGANEGAPLHARKNLRFACDSVCGHSVGVRTAEVSKVQVGFAACTAPDTARVANTAQVSAVRGRVHGRRFASTQRQRCCVRANARVVMQGKPPSGSPTVEQVGDMIARHVLETYLSGPLDQLQNGADQKCKRVLFGICGVPGAGKSSTCERAFRTLGKLDNGRLRDRVAMLPMDGFHFSRSELDAMEDPTSMHARRGAEFTFNAASFAQKLQEVRDAVGEKTVKAPGFDHALKDPSPDVHVIPPSVQVVLVEGNYLLLDTGLWRSCKVRQMCDEVWFLDVCPVHVALSRVKRRLITEIGLTESEADKRIRDNDSLNAVQILDSRKHADRVVTMADFF